jgi:DNA-binding LytR/AlgR family response regulator
LQVAKLANGRCHTFVTAYDEYAVTAFEEGAVDARDEAVLHGAPWLRPYRA